MEKDQQVDPLAPSIGQYPRSDQESLSNHMEQEKRQKRRKLAAYIAAFAVFQVIVILVFVLVIMKVRTPKFRVGTPQIQAFTSNIGPAASSFNMTLIAPFRLKNPNFGRYKYDSTTVVFSYGDATVGQVVIPKGKANFKSTQKFDATVTLNSNSLSNASSSSLGTDLTSGVLSLTSSAKLNGKVHLMLIFKKKKSTSMDCTMTISTSSQTVQSVTCK